MSNFGAFFCAKRNLELGPDEGGLGWVFYRQVGEVGVDHQWLQQENIG